jgi:hypothetical protein
MAQRRTWWHPRRIDVLFGVGAIGFFTQLLRETPSETIVYASIALMGLPIVQRIDTSEPRKSPPDDPVQ